MEDKITVFDFDGTYKDQDFYKNDNYNYINLSYMSGVNGYCDDESLKELEKIISNTDTAGINFLGSGNYHYMTYVLMQKIDKPFTLILFDHHTDMKPSMFEGLLSCGCWVKRALDENKYLKQVIIIGASEKLVDSIEDKYKDRVFCYSEQDIEHDLSWTSFLKKTIRYPIYISVDKDVIDNYEVKTNWDQGSLTLKEMIEIFEYLKNNNEVIGIDVCGECSSYEEIAAEYIKDSKINNEANKRIEQAAEEIIIKQEGMVN